MTEDFKAGLQFAVQEMRRVAAQLSKPAAEGLSVVADRLEVQHLTVDAPKLLILPLRWAEEPMESSSLYAGPIHFGNVYPMRSTQMWQIKCPTMVDVYTLCHPTLAAAKAALETAVINIGKET